jgi:ribosomal silencing factor RsfS
MRQSKITEYFVTIKNKSKRKIQSLITDFVEIEQKKNKQLVYGYNTQTESWHCLECGEDMGKK